MRNEIKWRIINHGRLYCRYIRFLIGRPPLDARRVSNAQKIEKCEEKRKQNASDRRDSELRKNNRLIKFNSTVFPLRLRIKRVSITESTRDLRAKINTCNLHGIYNVRVINVQTQRPVCAPRTTDKCRRITLLIAKVKSFENCLFLIVILAERDGLISFINCRNQQTTIASPPPVLPQTFRQYSPASLFDAWYSQNFF